MLMDLKFWSQIKRLGNKNRTNKSFRNSEFTLMKPANTDFPSDHLQSVYPNTFPYDVALKRAAWLPANPAQLRLHLHCKTR